MISLLKMLVLLCLMCSTHSFAQAKTTTDLQLQVLQSQYLSEGQNELQTESITSLGLKVKMGSNTDLLSQQWGADFLGLGSVDGTEQAYLALPELFYAKGFGKENKTQLILGRKKILWSKFDDEWRLGIWQPYVRWDYLHPKPQGLTGLFLIMGDKKISVKAFATPLFLPDQGPQFTVENGEFKSSNRWFRQPESRHTVMRQERRLNYDLDKPSEHDVLMNNAYGLSIVWGSELNGPWLRASMANKPINQFHIGIEGYHSITKVNRFFESVAVIHPVVARHTVTTVEAGLQGDNGGGWVSLTEERPEKPNLPQEWEEAPLYPSRFLGAAVTHRLPWSRFKRHMIKYTYMSLTEDLSVNKSSLMTDSIESSLNRFPYRSVAGFEWNAPISDSVKRKIDFNLRYLYSIPEQGSLLSTQISLQYERNLRWDLGCDILGSNVPDNDPNSGLMSRYRQNDRFMAGMTYVF